MWRGLFYLLDHMSMCLGYGFSDAAFLTHEIADPIGFASRNEKMSLPRHDGTVQILGLIDLELLRVCDVT